MTPERCKHPAPQRRDRIRPQPVVYDVVCSGCETVIGMRTCRHEFTATSPTSGAVTELDFCAKCGVRAAPRAEGLDVERLARVLIDLDLVSHPEHGPWEADQVEEQAKWLAERIRARLSRPSEPAP